MKDKTRVTAVEVRFVRQMTKYTQMDYRRNGDTLKELKIELQLDSILKYKDNWAQHVDRMQRNGLCELLKDYKLQALRS